MVDEEMDRAVSWTFVYMLKAYMLSLRVGLMSGQIQETIRRSGETSSRNCGKQSGGKLAESGKM